MAAGADAQTDQREGLPWWASCASWLLCFVSAALSQTSQPADEPLWRLPLAVAQNLWLMGPGCAFAASVMAILAAHELGHMVMARRYGVRHAWPLFVPAPTLFGTLGAVMSMRSLAPTKSALLRVAVAGPLCGGAVAMPMYFWGMRHGDVADAQALAGHAASLGHSIITAVLSGASVGEAHIDAAPSPMALAGWLGLFWTGLNLAPMGQLDGGHILFAVLPRWHKRASLGVAALLSLMAACAFVATWAPGAWVWPLLAIGACVGGLRHEGVGDEGVSPLTALDWALMVLAQGLWLGAFVAVPLWPHGALSLAP